MNEPPLVWTQQKQFAPEALREHAFVVDLYARLTSLSQHDPHKASHTLNRCRYS
jgi:hypothetical protein